MASTLKASRPFLLLLLNEKRRGTSFNGAPSQRYNYILKCVVIINYASARSSLRILIISIALLGIRVPGPKIALTPAL